MTSLFLSPHDDDQALFGAFTCLRERPLVVVCFDSYVQPNRGEVGCSAEERARETYVASQFLGCSVLRLGLRDDSILPFAGNALERALFQFQNIGTVYAPSRQGGNWHHDLVHDRARAVFEGRVVEYTTYTKTELWTTGAREVIGTPDEHARKLTALKCYPSQWRINRPHFEAVIGKNEWLNP